MCIKFSVRDNCFLLLKERNCNMCNLIDLIQRVTLNKKEKAESLLNEFFENRIDNALEETLKENKRFQEISKETCEKAINIDKINLSKEQWKAVDSALCASSHRGAEYGRVAYYQGFKDAVSILFEISQLL